MSTLEEILNQCNYHHNTRSYLLNECRSVIERVRSLYPRTSGITIQGMNYQCLALEGTIQVVYKDNNTYNIPLKIVYYNGYPQVAPHSRVLPTAEMMIRSSEYVREDGTVTLDILANWNPSCTTFHLIEQLSYYFGIKMPVFRKQSPVKRMRKIYPELQKELDSEIKELEDDSKMIDRKEQELEEFNNEDTSAYYQKVDNLNATIRHINTWLYENENKNVDDCDVQDLIHWSDLRMNEYLNCQALEYTYEDAAKIIIDSFSKGKIEWKDATKGLKEMYYEQFLKARLREKIYSNN